MNTVLYILTWIRVHQQDKISKRIHSVVSASSRAAKSMSLFVFAYFVEWWPLFVFGFWSLFSNTVPQVLMHCLVIFANIGGILNLIVYTIIRRRHSGDQEPAEKAIKHSDSNKTSTTDTVEMPSLTN